MQGRAAYIGAGFAAGFLVAVLWTGMWEIRPTVGSCVSVLNKITGDVSRKC